MNTKRNSGLLIAIDGIDGAGKTTQVEFLRKVFSDAGMEVVCSKEPTDGEWGSKLRESAQNGRLSLEDELDLFVKDRRDHVETLITPELEAGKIVILDRYYYSTITYQGARGANIDEVTDLMSEFPTPDKTFVFDLDPNLAVSRIRDSRNETPNEFEGVEYLTRVRDKFNKLDMDEIVKIDSSQSAQIISKQILDDLIETSLRSHLCAKEHECDVVYCMLRIANQCEWFTKQGELKSSLN